jgi:tetratricopeptide (TPR) repeat protein
MCDLALARFSSLDVAEEAIFRAIDLLPEKGEQFLVRESHFLLGDVYRINGKMEKAIYHVEVALRIATAFEWHDELFRIHLSLARLFLEQDRFDDGHAHIDRAMLYTVNSAFNLGGAMWLRAMVWLRQYKVEEARSEVLRAADVFEKLGASRGMESCGKLLGLIQKAEILVTSGELREFLQITPLPARIDFLFQAQRTE